jgi:hypothetical protein
MTDRELMQMALDTFNDLHNNVSGYTELWRGAFDREIALLERRLAQPEREWQGLTDEEMLDAYAPNRIPDSAYSNMGEDLKKIHDATKEEMLSGLRAIEAKLKLKNGYAEEKNNG